MSKWPENLPTLPPWDDDLAAARALQIALAQRARLDDDFAPLRTIAGIDVGFEEEGAVTRAAAVLLDADSYVLLEETVARCETNMPYVAGMLSFRELPALLMALGQLSRQPDLVMCDGHGIAHPRRLGIAAHFGVITGLPSIGVAKKILVGNHGPLGQEKGARAELTHRGQRLGVVLRSKERTLPLIVSPGHRVSIESAADLVLRAALRHRLPEPTRLADRIASQRLERAAQRKLALLHAEAQTAHRERAREQRLRGAA